jgi:Carboxypeptidase regulatory-like domain
MSRAAWKQIFVRVYRNSAVIFMVCLAASFLSSPAFAQMNTADITGNVTDPTGAVVPGATVTALQVATQQKHTVTTGEGGEYLFAQLPLGEYSLTVDATGFKQSVQHLTLHAADHLRQDFPLQVGDANQSVTVEGNAGLMQVESAEIKDVIQNQQVVDLPLKGRDFLELAVLSPGVVNPPGGTRGDSLQQTGKLINVLGNRTGHNLFLVDGVSVTDEYFNNVALNPSPDTTREFNMELTDYSAEFGGKSGGVINVITKSGGNDFHGSVYEFVRNNIFDAQNYFAPANVPAPFRENQFGAAIGGPIVKNKTFFFVNYDGQRVRDSLSQLFSVPTAAQRAGDLSGLVPVATRRLVDPLTKATIANNDLRNDPGFNPNNPATRAALGLLNILPQPNRPGNSNNLLSVGQQKIGTNQYNARLDQQVSSADSVFARASVFDANQLDPFGSSVLNEALLPGFGRLLKTHTVNLSVGETHIFSPNVVNEFRFGWLRVSGGQKDPNAGNPFASAVGLAGVTANPADMGYPQVSLSGVFSTIGTATGFNTRVDRDFEFFDNVSFHRGKHDFTFGAYFFHLAFNPSFPNNARGVYTFASNTSSGAPLYSGNAFADFLLGYPSQGQVGIGEGAENAHTNWAHFYFQDGWQLTTNLKLDLGVRYEYNSNLVAGANQTSDIDLSTGAARFVVAGNTANLSSTAATLAAFAAAQNPTIPVVSNSTVGWNNSLLDSKPLRLSPRIGLAWQVPHTRGMVVRGGFGVFTNQAAYSVLQNLAENIPFFLTKTVNNTAVTPALTTATILAANPNGAIGANSVNHDFKVEYNEVWNLSAQKEIAKNTTLSIQYVGSRTVHADSSTAVNLPTPGAGAVQARRPFPNLNSFTAIRWDGWASFHGFTVEAKHRVSHGLSFDASYTLSHSIDDASDAGATNAEFNLPQNIYANNLAIEKATSSFDHRNRFVGNVLYDLPFARGTSGSRWMRAVAADWKASGILIAQSGSPFTVNLSSSNDVANIGLVGGNNLERPQQIADPNAGPNTAQTWFNTAAFALPSAFTFGNTPRNSVQGPGYVNLDASLQKQWQLCEAMDLQFRVDVYNFLNHPNFNLPGRIFGTSNFGVIPSALDPREMQFALKFEF